MEIELTVQAKNDLAYWNRTGNKVILRKIRTLLEDILNTPFSGIGKPEALKHNLSGKWSRRITQSDRLIYEVTGEIIYVFSLKGHYK
jgi:toxin YoeB